MIAAGLRDETAALLAHPRGLSRTAGQALGYGEMIDHLQGRGTLAETITTIQTSTRQFAKRQHTWFRNLAECREVKMRGDETAAELAEQLLESR
jgi:tRNA dimethylallyltransferase